MGADVRPATPADTAALSRVLGRAFFDDPVMCWLLPDARARHHHLPRGGVEVAAPGTAGIGAAALWDPPGQWQHATGEELRAAPSKSRLDRCDAEYAPAYLESSNEANVPYYGRFGFEVTQELTLPGGGPTLWGMWRRPR